MATSSPANIDAAHKAIIGELDKLMKTVEGLKGLGEAQKGEVLKLIKALKVKCEKGELVDQKEVDSAKQKVEALKLSEKIPKL